MVFCLLKLRFYVIPPNPMIRPRKRFGQHFLRDPAIIDNIISLITAKPEDHLLEIGPGDGALTFPLLKKIKKLNVIELDRDLIALLEEKSKQYGELIIHAGDVLDIDFASLKPKESKLRLFGNLPYNISTPLIFHLLSFSSLISEMLLMVQKEVAMRLAAKPHTKAYGRLSIMVQYHCAVELLLDIPPSAFYPPPAVQSSFIRLTPFTKKPTVVQNERLFESLVRQAFNMRRKTLRNSLKGWVDDEIWADVQISSDARPEELTVQDFVALCNAIDK